MDKEGRLKPCPWCGSAAAKMRELEAENAALRQERDRLSMIVEKADALYQASKFQCFRKEFEKAQDAYQEARYAG